MLVDRCFSRSPLLWRASKACKILVYLPSAFRHFVRLRYPLLLCSCHLATRQGSRRRRWRCRWRCVPCGHDQLHVQHTQGICTGHGHAGRCGNVNHLYELLAPRGKMETNHHSMQSVGYILCEAAVALRVCDGCSPSGRCTEAEAESRMTTSSAGRESAHPLRSVSPLSVSISQRFVEVNAPQPPHAKSFSS